MPVARPSQTRSYFLLLMLNIIGGSLLLLPLLDATAHNGDHLVVITIVSLIWPPLSVAISLMLLKYWASELTTSFLPTFSADFESTDADAPLGDKMVLVAFLHMLMMLSRILAYVSGECKVPPIPSTSASCLPAYWARIGVRWILVSVIIFSQCLFALNIDMNRWGYFHLLYQFVIFILKAAIVLVGAFIDLFNTIQGSFRYFRMNWATAGTLPENQELEGATH